MAIDACTQPVPKVYFSLPVIAAGLLSVDLRVRAASDVPEHRQWVFGHIGHGKGAWEAFGRFP